VTKAEYLKEYRLKNRQKIKEYNLKNREKKLKYLKEYRLKNKEKIKEYKHRNRDKALKYGKEYNLKNKEKLLKQISKKIAQNIKTLAHPYLKERARKLGFENPSPALISLIKNTIKLKRYVRQQTSSKKH
jgi:hypothetical protein